MSTELTTTTKPKASALAAMAQRFSIEPKKLYDTLRQTVFKECRSEEELIALVIVANEYGLNPLTKELYAFPAKGGGIVPVVSVDGWVRMANEHPQMDGAEFEFDHDSNGKLVACTCIIYRKDRTRPVKVTEYLSECKRATDPWKMEHRMLRHKAFIQCSRVAFGFSGIHDEDEARDVAGRVVDAEVPAAQVPLFKEPAPSKPAPVLDAGFSLDASPVSTLEELRAKMQAAGLSWQTVAGIAEGNGLFVSADTPLEELPEDTAREILSVWERLVTLA